jgi:tRNA (guanine-N7-)-methyltransferase
VTVTEAAADSGPQAAHLHIRTFHPRRGRLGPTRGAALDRLWPAYGYEIDPTAVTPTAEADPRAGGASPCSALGGSSADPRAGGAPGFDAAALFGREAPLVLDIGCGMGEATAAMAAADPARDYLGVDVHTPGLGNLLVLAVDRAGLANVRAARGDAVELLRDLMKPGALDAIHVFFPDPWPKAKHHKRRLIRPDIVALMRDRLRVGGVLHCATDWTEYAEHMLEVLSADPGLRNRHDGFTPRPPSRPVTKFERRALQAGRPVSDLIFARV